MGQRPKANITDTLTTSGPKREYQSFLLLLRIGGETETQSGGGPCLKSHRKPGRSIAKTVLHLLPARAPPLLAATFLERDQRAHQHKGQGHAFSSFTEDISRLRSLPVVGIPGQGAQLGRTRSF